MVPSKAKRHVPAFVTTVLTIAFLLSSASARQSPAWSGNGVSYAVGAIVTFQGCQFRAQIGHVSQPDWSPTAAPALWVLVSGNCGPPPPPPTGAVFFDNFETDQGWTTNGGGTDTAATGFWERGDPQPTSSGGPKQLDTPPSNSNTLVTGRLAGSGAGNFDIDAGVTSVRSPAITIPSSGTVTLTFQFYLAHGANASSADFFRAAIVSGSAVTTVFEELGGADNDNAVFMQASASLDNFRGQTVQIQFESADLAGASLVEAAVDDVAVRSSDGGGGGGGGGGGACSSTDPGTEQPFPPSAFAPYADMLLGNSGFDLAGTNAAGGARFFTLAFVIDDNVGNCVASWGGGIRVVNDQTEPNFLVCKIRDLRARGGGVVISFGGANGPELATVCTSVASLQAQLQSVVDKYRARHLDFDIEGASIEDAAANDRRAKAIAAVQRANAGLDVSFTLPVLPTGVLDSSLALLRNAIANGVNISIVNVMAFDYGSAFPGDMGQLAIQAVSSTAEQLGQQGLFPNLALAQRLRKMGATLMIGHDDQGRTTSQADANEVLSTATQQGWGRLSFWSANRDRQCPSACSGNTSITCSCISQQNLEFQRILNGFNR